MKRKKKKNYLHYLVQYKTKFNNFVLILKYLIILFAYIL